MIRFYLDEMYSQIVAKIARDAGVDIVSSHERAHDGTPDLEVLRIAAQEARCVVTDNHEDFIGRTMLLYEHGEPHSGVILVPRSVGHRQFARLARAIIRFAEDNPDGLQPYEIRWLQI